MAKTMRRAIVGVFAFGFLSLSAAGQAQTADRWQTKENAEFLRQLGFFHGLMRLNSGNAVLKDITFSDGTIEFDVNTIGRGAPGIAFRQQGQPAAGPAVELRLMGDGGLDAADLYVVRQAVPPLLATGAIRAEWRDCSTLDRRCPDTANSGVFPVYVRLIPIRETSNRDVCGEVIHDALTGAPTIRVYLPPHADLVHAIRLHPDSRLNPPLGTLRVGHVVGLTIAHEIGHALNVPHARSGLMKAHPGMREILALREARLQFTTEQRARIWATLHPALERLAKAPPTVKESQWR